MKIIIKNELYEGKSPYIAKEIVTKLEINITAGALIFSN